MFAVDQRVLQRRLEVDDRSGRAEVGRRRRVQRLLALERVDAVLALVVADEARCRLVMPPSLSTTGDQLPPSASVYCRSSPFFRSSVQML